MEITTILDQIDLGAMALPEFQRGYVWNTKQVRELMNSLYRRYPVGGLLVWVTKTEHAEARGDHALSAGNVKLILDGQQRVTSLYGIIRGTPPPFFEGNAGAFTDLYFNLDEEAFEFYGPVKMRDNPLWVSVTEVMKNVSPFIQRVYQNEQLMPKAEAYVNRLTQLQGIKNIRFHIEEVTGQDKSVDVVVDIFNKVNSGGTKLSKGDLALARICAEWPDARQELRRALKVWQNAGFHFSMDWLLRNVNTVVTGEALFTALKEIDAARFQTGLKLSEKAINYLLNIIGGRLGLDHDRVLGGRYAFPVITHYLAKQGGKFHNSAERDRMLYWYVHTFIWGRFAGSTESFLNRDLGVMEDSSNPINSLIEELKVWRGDLVVRPENFAGWSKGARFYPMLYLLTRVGQARDWGTGLPLKADLLGKTSGLQIHHIFPKAQLYKRDYLRSEVNALANFCFLTQTTNLEISDNLPEIYFREIEARFPGALASQWIPADPSLWRMENYLEFLTERQKLLANAANAFLDELLHGTGATTDSDVEVSENRVVVRGGIDSVKEEELLLNLNIWVEEQGLPPGEMLYELLDESGNLIEILDLVWPNGLQTGLSEPAALLIDEDMSVLEAASSEGFRCFTDIDDFKAYVQVDILALETA